MSPENATSVENEDMKAVQDQSTVNIAALIHDADLKVVVPFNKRQPKPHGGRYGEIFAREEHFICLYTSPDRNISVLNSLLRSVNCNLFAQNVWWAIKNGEIHRDLIPEIQQVLECSREWEYLPLLHEDINITLQAFLRWLLMTYGGPQLWADFSNAEYDRLENLLKKIQDGELIKRAEPRFLNNTDHALQFFSDMLNENMTLDCFAGLFDCDEKNRICIVRSQTGISNFAKNHKENIRISPTKLLMWVDHTLRMWRKAVEVHQPDSRHTFELLTFLFRIYLGVF